MAIPSPTRTAVIGAGSWGTALAWLLADRGDDVIMWAYESECADAINAQHENTLYLPDATLPPNLRATTSLEEALTDAELIVWVTPSHVARSVLERAEPFSASVDRLVARPAFKRAMARETELAG